MYSIKFIVNIFAYLSALISFLSIFKYINPVYSLIFLFLLGFSIYFEKNNVFPIKRIFLNIISVLVVLFSLLKLSVDDPITPVVETLTVLLGIKLIENKEFRDYMQIFTISVFLLAGSALLSIDIIFLFYFLLLFFTISIGVIFLTFYSQKKDIYLNKNQILSILTKTLIIPVLSIPTTIFLFLVLPRTDYPLFNFLNKNKTAISGFSDKVSLGDVSEIQEDNSIVFRVKMQKLPEDKLYFRGVVLDYFDGLVWKRTNTEKVVKFNFKGKKIKSTVFLNPYGKNYLFSLNVPVDVKKIEKYIYSDFTFEAKKQINNVVKYQVYSILTDKIKIPLKNKNLYLQIPEKLNKDIIKLAKQLKGNKNPDEFAKFLTKFFYENYKYSLKDLPTGKDALYKFLFVKKIGNCEFFASATALFFRINKIPSRIIAGYKGADYNNIGKYYAVFNKNAHTWVEYYYNGYWHTVDTTPNLILPEIAKRENSTIFKIKLLFDVINYYYLNFVIDFNLQKQINIFRSVSDSIYSLKDFSKFTLYLIKNNLIYILFVICFGILIIKIYRYYSIPLEKRILNKFYRKLKKYGYSKKENEGLEEFADKIKDEKLKNIVILFVKEFEEIYFKDQKINKNKKEKLKKILKRI